MADSPDCSCVKGSMLATCKHCYPFSVGHAGFRTIGEALTCLASEGAKHLDDWDAIYDRVTGAELAIRRADGTIVLDDIPAINESLMREALKAVNERNNDGVRN